VGLEEVFPSPSPRERIRCHQWGWGVPWQKSLWQAVLHWGVGGEKRAERLTGDKQRCREETLGQEQGWGAVGRDPGLPPERPGRGPQLRGSQE